MLDFDNIPNKLDFAIRDHYGKKEHFDIVIGQDECIAFFSTAVDNTEQLINQFENEYLGIGKTRSCEPYMSQRIGKKVYLSGKWEGQWYITTMKGKVVKKPKKHSFILVVTSPMKYRGFTFLVWGFPSNEGGRQWVIKRDK